MILLGKVVLFVWALLLLWVGYLLVNGQSQVLFNAIDAGRWSEAAMQAVFITVVIICTIAAFCLFTVVGVLRE
jgi:hypothetical protein